MTHYHMTISSVNSPFFLESLNIKHVDESDNNYFSDYHIKQYLKYLTIKIFLTFFFYQEVYIIPVKRFKYVPNNYYLLLFSLELS